MTLIKDVRIKNFKCYREEHVFPLLKSNYFVGPNNAGKSAVLKAIHCFFDENEFIPEFLNQTEYRSRGVGFNRSVIAINFDFTVISQKTLRTKLISTYGKSLILTKHFTYREASQSIVINFAIKRKNQNLEQLSIDLRKMLNKISVSYIHPQEATKMLDRAQEKLKNRLLSNWGRNAQLADTLKELQLQWNELRSKANSYLSNGLTNSLQGIWPGCATKVDLPEKIENVIGISEILFKSFGESTEVSLTSQGTGAQSTILYQTHYLLDSDKTLHRGFYYPIWLIEEPESFLHADIIFKLGFLLCSDEWLDNIQMLISTHSPLLLATTKTNESNINWFHMENHDSVHFGKVEDWESDDIKEIGILMGDPNFDVYFESADKSNLIFIEDKKEITKEKFIASDIPVTNALNGVSEQKRYFEVLRAMDISLNRKIFFIIDNDDGLKEFQSEIKNGNLLGTSKSGFKKYGFENNVNLILLPQDHASEELFEEYDQFLEFYASILFNSEFTGSENTNAIPPNLTRAHAHIRNKKVKGLQKAKELIRNLQDIKNIFWDRVEEEELEFNKNLMEELKKLII